LKVKDFVKNGEVKPEEVLVMEEITGRSQRGRFLTN